MPLRRVWRRIERLLSSSAAAPGPAAHSLTHAEIEARRPTYKQWWNESAGTMRDAFRATIDDLSEEDYRRRGSHGDANSPGATQLVARCGLGPESRVLEVGPGVARIGREMAPLVKEWHGADISSNMLALAAQRTAHLTNVHLHEIPSLTHGGGAPRLPAGPFDLVYMTVVLMHLDKEDVFEYLLGLRQVVREGGWAYFDTWNILHPDVFRMWRLYMAPGEPKARGRFQCCSPEEFRAYVERAGFEIVEFEAEDRLVRAWCRLASRAGLRPHGDGQDDGWAPFGYVGAPTNETVVSGPFEVTGWALDNVQEVLVTVGGRPAQQARLGQPNPQVEAAFADYAPEAARSSWLLPVDPAGLPPGPIEIRAVAKDAQGRTGILSGFYHGVVYQPGAAQASAPLT